MDHWLASYLNSLRHALWKPKMKMTRLHISDRQINATWGIVATVADTLSMYLEGG
jgi:hypothetical protein